MAVEQPAGTVTMVFTDIEGSTLLLEQLGTAAYRTALAEHRRIGRAACARHDGYEVDNEGDAFFYAFSSAQLAVAAVSEVMASSRNGPIRIRVGIHAGEPELDPPKYVGLDVHLAARIMGSAHGGQVVLSGEAARLVGSADLELCDLGEHRLKDIAAPVPIFQLGTERFPPLKTISNTNLPHPASSFIGRERELAELVELLRGKQARLLSLTGPGGTGKTRLAIEAAASVVTDYKAGVFWVGLATLRDPALVTEAIGQTLGAKDGLASHIREREMLLLLDNLEQVIGAAPALSQLLHSCPNLSVLVTSRELLRVQGEVEFRVPPLAGPEAIGLFCERSRLEPSSEVAELCDRLDSLPLAVELAAARTNLLSPAQILERLSSGLDLLKGGRDADPRQQTLSATIEWSHDLLSPEEQRLFARLSVFVGGSTLAAAEEIAEGRVDTLESVVDKSLLRRSSDRLWMLETIREYAEKRLEGSSESDEVRRRHSDFFTKLAMGLEPELRSGTQATALARLEEEHANLRAALDFLGSGHDVAAEARLAGACWYFWYTAGHLKEGTRRLTAALARAGEAPPAIRATLHDGLCTIGMVTGDRAGALRHAEESLRLRHSVDDPAGLLRSLLNRGGAATTFGDQTTAEAMFADCAALARSVGDRWFLGVALANLGVVARERGAFERSRSLEAEALELFEELGDTALVAGTSANLAVAEIALGAYDEAGSRLAQLLARIAGQGLPEMLIWCFEGLAAVEAYAGDPERGARLLGVSESIAESIAYALSSNRAWQARIRSLLSERLGEAPLRLAMSEGRLMTLDAGLDYALGGRRRAQRSDASCMG